MTGWWVLADIRSVQRFIFETDVLAQMRGASTLVKDFDDFVSHAANQRGGDVEIGLGGTYRVKFESDSAARDFEAALAADFEPKVGLPATRLATVVVPAGDRPVAYRALAEARGRRQALVSTAPPLAGRCGICRVRPVSNRLGVAGEDVTACTVCARRHRAAMRSAGWAGDTRDLGEFARSSRPAGYLAVLVADGDSIGRAMMAAQDDVALSRRLGDATRVAVEEVANSCGLRFVPQWVGGDDAVLVVQPQHALPTAIALVRTFSDRASGPGSRITMSCGVVITHATMPFSNILALGEQLLDRAKAARRKAGVGAGDAGFVDIGMTSSSAARGIENLPGDAALEPMEVASSDGDLDILDTAVRELVRLRTSRAFVRTSLEQLTDTEWAALDEEVQDALAEVRTRGLLPRLRQLHELRLGADRC